ncbi:MAG: hypothetical protein KAH84_10365 [Thiomargarita sp.]|nr:hypothetical protein [Thiomargarita sp.]
MSKYQIGFLFLFSLLLIACGGDDEKVATSATDSNSEEDLHYVQWEDNANGEWVVDATGDKLRFEADTGYMNFGNTVYDNVFVDDDANFIIDDVIEGAIEYVLAENEEIIVAIVALDGTYLDIIGAESDLFVDNTDIESIPATLSAAFNSQNQTPRILSPKLSAPNALVENNQQTKIGFLQHK